MAKLAFFLSLLTSAQAFTASPSFGVHTAQTHAHQFALQAEVSAAATDLSELETLVKNAPNKEVLVDALLTQTEDCVEGECSVDQVSELVDVLKLQQKDLQMRVDAVNKMIASLEHANDANPASGKPREVDEVRETVRAIARIFQMGDKGSVSKPAGYSGDVGKGATTAYDSLPPKKWTNPDKK